MQWAQTMSKSEVFIVVDTSVDLLRVPVIKAILAVFTTQIEAEKYLRNIDASIEWLEIIRADLWESYTLMRQSSGTS